MSVSEAARSPRNHFQTLRTHNYGGFWFVLCLLAAVPIFWTGFVSLGDAWITPEYSHGPLIPLLSGYLFLRDMRKVPAVDGPITDRGPGLIITLIAITIAILGNLVRIGHIVVLGRSAEPVGAAAILLGVSDDRIDRDGGGQF